MRSDRQVPRSKRVPGNAKRQPLHRIDCQLAFKAFDICIGLAVDTDGQPVLHFAGELLVDIVVIDRVQAKMKNAAAIKVSATILTTNARI
jgi:hypothetical protein